ncbi:MAG: adenylate/guanylate cyclase domain-containing protein, partial [Lachnospiraceae bacterium]|nr:adenylate/guanylate cyclase domain-containing protein [Lachnospiraceae bacterium]
LILYRAGIILHVLWVPLFVTILFIASIALNYMRAAMEKRRVQSTFGRYIDPAVMRQLLDKGEEELELGGKEYNIAVLFVDIRGFTTMSEALDPKTVVEIINKYLTLTTKCIMQNHGTLDKFVGDCTMAFWNAPVAQEDPVYLACRAAMDMVEESKALGEELQERFGRSVSFGVGVNWGPAVVGNIGAPLRMDYTAIGDTVNTAARLEANAPGGKVYISRAVADELGDRITCTSLGDSIKLKGKAEGFEVLELNSIV